MSATTKALILAKAIEIWSDPKKRIQGDIEARGGYCALGALARAAHEIEGVPMLTDEEVGDANPKAARLAALIGMTPVEVTNLNDKCGTWGLRKYGRRTLYQRMKKELAKELA